MEYDIRALAERLPSVSDEYLVAEISRPPEWRGSGIILTSIFSMLWIPKEFLIMEAVRRGLDYDLDPNWKYHHPASYNAKDA